MGKTILNNVNWLNYFIERSSSNGSLRPHISFSKNNNLNFDNHNTQRSDIVSSAGRSIIADYKMPYNHKPINKLLSHSHSYKDLKHQLDEISLK